ncbi:MAG: putative conjugal transfer protein [Chloroflexi bacterium]|nr:putative conjugal transfer protein [Chloroflexota bacterium]
MNPNPRTDAPRFKGRDIERIRQHFSEELARKLETLFGDFTKSQALEYLNEIYAQADVNLSDRLKKHIFQKVLDDLHGYGPIQALLKDESITEIMVNGPRDVYVERDGKLVKTNVIFEDDAHVKRVIDKIVLPLGRRVDADSPTVDARLPDGSRVNAVIPPVAIDGPSITIRKFSEDKLQVEDIIEFGSISRTMSNFLNACVVGRLNVVISGGTGSGKTTLLNILSGFIPSDERIVTIEDSAELQLHQDHVVRLETKPPTVEGEGEVTIRHLVRNSLRMRPDRIVVGEVRGGEALDMLQAMNTGHDGSLTTLHANTPRDALSRLETMSLMAGLDMPLDVIREQIASAVDVIVQQARLSDGSRKVTFITEVAGMEGNTIVMTDIFKFEQTKIDNGKIIGELKPTGMRPMFSERLVAAGFELSPEMFGADIKSIMDSRRRWSR